MMLQNLNTIFWVLIFLILTLQLFTSEEFSLILSLFYSFSITLTCYLYARMISRYIIPPRFNTSDAGMFFFLRLLLLSILCAIILTTEDYLIESINRQFPVLPLKPGPLMPVFFSTWMASILITGIGYAFELNRHHIDSLKKQQQLREELMNMELQSIRYQLSPHFTFNILNNLQFLIQKDSKEAMKLLAEYSKVLRYYVYESRNPVILVTDEIAFIKSYIAIEQQRLGTGLVVEAHWDIPTEPRLKIAPFILSSYVENAFKHLASGNKHIRLQCFIKEEILVFRLENSYDKHRSGQSGVGLSHTLKRLGLIYPDRHQLRISNEEGFFIVELHIKPETGI